MSHEPLAYIGYFSDRVSLSLFLFFLVRGLELRTYILTNPPALYCEGFFQDRVSRTICLGWLGTVILLISTSWVAKITGVSH
jgi:hypothetical protein